MTTAIFLLLSAIPALACTCAPPPSPKEAWLEAPLVFAGIIEKTDPTITPRRGAGEQTAWARVTEPFKGVKNDQVLVLYDRFNGCFGGFPKNVPYLFYLFPGEKPRTWHMAVCHRSRDLSGAVEDLKFLRGLPASAHGNIVSGTVRLSEGYQTRYLPGIPVHAVSASKSYDTVTDADGVYEFRNVPPATYTITVDYPKGMTLRYSTAVGRIHQAPRRIYDGTETTVLGATPESANGFDFTLAPDTRITGRVLDPGGHPMKGVCLDIQPLHANPTRSTASDCTKPDGSFLLDKMVPGTYRLIANPDGVISAAEPFGRLYYPGTLDPAKAATIAIVAGQPLTGLRLHVPQVAPRHQLSGRLIFSDGTPLPNQSVAFHPVDGGRQHFATTDLNGAFTLQILAGRPGNLSAQIYLWRGQESECPQFDAKFNPNSHAAILHTTPYPIAADKSIDAIHVVFPFPSCDAWLKQQARRKP